MKTYETSGTVEEQGRIQVAGVPFAPGTEVEISISPKANPVERSSSEENTAIAAARDRMRELFQSIKGFRNSPRISREELHERGRFH
jgi:hypothetical protein